jgi:outer membrane protein OmpA-like peptidoglycan-associated protein
MIPLTKKGADPWTVKPQSSAETFWASYSDLMAGLLMIFTLTTVITLLDIGERFVEPKKDVQEWKQIVDNICTDKDLKAIDNVEVDCDTGALVISEDSLRFGFGRTDLGNEAKEALRQAVPKYMSIIKQHSGFFKRIQMIEISGHTDREDKGHANPVISRERAGKVLQFLMDDLSMVTHRDLLKAKAVTAGYAATRFPKSCGQDRCDEARRVEIAIKLNETGILREILDILKQVIK